MELDKDLKARQEAREAACRSEAAQKILGSFSQEKLDAITQHIAKCFHDIAPELAELAVKETGFGNAKDKTLKNQFASQGVYNAIKEMKTVGVLRKLKGEKLWEIGVPVGVIAASGPSTNPTSTV